MAKAAKAPKKTITIWLDSNYMGDEPEYYRCPRCGVVVVEYEGREIYEVPGRSPVLPSHIIKCKGNYRKRNGNWEACGRYYTFAGVVYTRNPEMTE